MFYNSTTNCIDIISNGAWQSIFCPCPVISPVISGTSPVCPSSSGNVYTVTNTTGAATYTWSLSSGASGSSTTNSISVTAPASGTFNVSCTVTNACGTGYAATPKTVSLVAAPSTAAITTTLASICQGTTSSGNLVGNSGTISSGSGQWTVTAGPSGYAGHLTFGAPTSTTTTVIADATAPAGAYTVTWTITNTPCTQTSTATTTVTVVTPPSTAVISSGGGQSLCPGATAASNLVGNSGTIASGTGTWSVTNGPSGYAGHMTFGNASSPTTSVSADGGAPSGSYTVTWTIANSPCTPNSSTTTTITVLAAGSAAVIKGATTSVSAYTNVGYAQSNVVFSVAPVTGATYAWSASATTGTPTVTGGTTSSCTVSWASTGTVGVANSTTISVTVTPPSGCPSIGSISVTAGGKTPYYCQYTGCCGGSYIEGANQTFTTNGQTSLFVKLWGAGGAGNSTYGNSGGSGGFVSGTLTVTPNTGYTVVVGMGGFIGRYASTSSTSAGYGLMYGGGGADGASSSTSSNDAGSGGGRSAIQ